MALKRNPAFFGKVERLPRINVLNHHWGGVGKIRRRGLLRGGGGRLAEGDRGSNSGVPGENCGRGGKDWVVKYRQFVVTVADQSKGRK